MLHNATCDSSHVTRYWLVARLHHTDAHLPCYRTSSGARQPFVSAILSIVARCCCCCWFFLRTRHHQLLKELISVSRRLHSHVQQWPTCVEQRGQSEKWGESVMNYRRNVWQSSGGTAAGVERSQNRWDLRGKQRDKDGKHGNLVACLLPPSLVFTGGGVWCRVGGWMSGRGNPSSILQKRDRTGENQIKMRGLRDVELDQGERLMKEWQRKRRGRWGGGWRGC